MCLQASRACLRHGFFDWMLLKRETELSQRTMKPRRVYAAGEPKKSRIACDSGDRLPPHHCFFLFILPRSERDAERFKINRIARAERLHIGRFTGGRPADMDACLAEDYPPGALDDEVCIRVDADADVTPTAPPRLQTSMISRSVRVSRMASARISWSPPAIQTPVASRSGLVNSSLSASLRSRVWRNCSDLGCFCIRKYLCIPSSWAKLLLPVGESRRSCRFPLRQSRRIRFRCRALPSLRRRSPMSQTIFLQYRASAYEGPRHRRLGVR